MLNDAQLKIYKENKLDSNNIPKHVAFIMDGNGRWAKKRLLPRSLGHKAGSEALKKIINAAGELGIKYLTFYVFSTENWKRPKEEVAFLMNYLIELTKKETPELVKKGVRVRCLGDLDVLEPKVLESLKFIEQETKNNNFMHVNLMINYGGRRELITAYQNMLDSKVQPKDLTEETFSKFLYTKDSPELDILVRTGGDVRISNFLLWQAAYAEFFFLDTLWPDFDKKALIKVLQEFQKRDRRFGGLN